MIAVTVNPVQRIAKRQPDAERRCEPMPVNPALRKLVTSVAMPMRIARPRTGRQAVPEPYAFD